MNSFRKYKVQRGETIEVIATKIGIPAVEARAFHNKYCELSDLVEFGLPIRRTEYILLPPLASETDLQLSDNNTPKKVILGNNNSLRLIAANGLKQEHGTIIRFKENNRLLNKVHFTSQITFLEINNDFSIVEYHVNQVYVNEKEPEMVVEQLADATSKALYPIVLSLNKNGQIHEILNIEAIQKRWELLKPSILQYYNGGNVITQLITSFERSIQSAPLLKRNLEEHPFYTIYFAPIYQDYTSDFSFSSNDNNLEIFQDINEFQTKTSKILLSRKGITKPKSNLVETALIHEDLNNNISKNSKFNLEQAAFEIGKLDDGMHHNMEFNYKLNHSNNTIFSIEGFINTRNDNNTITTIEFETYEKVHKKEQKEIINPVSEEMDWSSEIINEKVVKKRSFWDEFWGN
ncbi:hypothetical protein [Flavobacterium hercynium]|uniref:LysM domain-containing protein n=1 Tax=Flavobacterium hercynium TaxID=387094 RepID=A0A226GW27_9FLAO|nr:hypothetical protein [Flavobacterium hercynium]OXA85641.1 hypothetical protein B0A66_19130 [Flavobacterium hercynium]SMP36903.1 hypothetical protein SAMN06265346_12523 [Flavobacterium hercynium]